MDVDPARAGEKYELIRRDIVKLFECRGCFFPQDLADETINRVARKIIEGGEIREGALSAFFFGVARNVLKEHLRSPDREIYPMESLPAHRHPSEDPHKSALYITERHSIEQRLECLDRCLGECPPDARELIISYYKGEERGNIEARKRLAEGLGIHLNNLRIRIHRIREKLEKCVVSCLARLSEE